MFKNCCGCASKKASRQESEDDDDDGERKEAEGVGRLGKVVEEEREAAAAEIAEKGARVARDSTGGRFADEKEQKAALRKSSLKKPKPRLSISTEVKVIPTNFPEGSCPYTDGGEMGDIDEEKREGDEKEAEGREGDEEEDDEEVEDRRMPVKNIDGKMIKKSAADDDDDYDDDEGPSGGASPPEARNSSAPFERPISPLSDEVFVAGEKSALLAPLSNLGVKVGSTQTAGNTLDVPLAALSRGQVPAALHLKRGSMPAALQKWVSEEEDESGGTHEPPATPVARDEVALRRHRFFSELLTVAQAATEHRVRFDPFGPTIEQLSEYDPGPGHLRGKEFEALLSRLESITVRLEKAVPALEKSIEHPRGSPVEVTKSLEDLLDEHLTPAEKENLNLLIGNREEKEKDEEEEESSKREEDANAISPDSSADIEDLSDKDITLEGNVESLGKLLNGQSDISENSSNSQGTVVKGEDLREEQARVAEDSRPGDERDTGEDRVDTYRGEDCRKHVENDSGGLIVERFEMTNNQSTLNMSVQGFQDILQGPFAVYLQVSAKIGGDVAEHSKLVQQAFQAQLQYLSVAASSSRPSNEENAKLLKPTSDHIQAIQSFREKHRASCYFNHLSAISESVPALGWVTVSPAPTPFIKEMNDAGQFYTNRVLKDWKEKDKIHADWTKAWIQTLSELQAYVKQNHITGLVWGGTSAPRSGGGGSGVPPPPPVGMPPLPVFDLADAAPGDTKQDRSALFAEINQGENITKGLKKVTADMQTHKNPAIRTGPAPFKTPFFVANQSPIPYKTPSPPEKPPKFSREGKKWLIEYQTENHDLIVSEAEMNNVIYIFKCTDSTIVVKGKVNSIFVDSCKKTAVVFENVVSSIEFVNCQSVQMQVLGKVSTISVDKTDGCQMYLSRDSLETEIISSKSSEMNVLVPAENDDFTEYPVPEQFKTTVSQKGLSTIAVQSKG